MRHGIGRVPRRLAGVAACLLVAPAAVVAGTTAAWGVVATSVTIDGTKGGRTFDGIGAMRMASGSPAHAASTSAAAAGSAAIRSRPAMRFSRASAAEGGKVASAR